MSNNQGTGNTHTNQILGGYKATLNNDSASDSAKEYAREVLDQHDATTEPLPSSQKNPNPNPNRVIAGYKATLNNPTVSDEAKDKAEQYLQDHDVQVERVESGVDEEFVPE